MMAQRLTLRNAFQVLAARYPGRLFTLKWTSRGGLSSGFIATSAGEVGMEPSDRTQAHEDPLDALRELIELADKRERHARETGCSYRCRCEIA